MLPDEIEEIARRYVPGEGVVAVERLGLGLVNESYRATRDGGVYSLRVPVPDAAALGLDRGWECQVLATAMSAGVAPVIECCEPLLGILVTRWVEGRSWTAEQVRLPENIGKLAQLARRIHALPVPPAARRMSPPAWITEYRETLNRRGVAESHLLAGSGRRLIDLRSGLEMRLAALAEQPSSSSALCHGDLHAQNLIAGSRGLVLLDWEYAHVSEQYWDLAGWIGNNDLGADSGRLLLARYLGRQPTAQETTRLNELVWVYDYVCLLWSELYLKLEAGPAGASISGRAQLLAARLQSESGGRAG
jgi:thiamine kinase-like enzyme